MSFRSDLVFNYITYTSSIGAALGFFIGVNTGIESGHRYTINHRKCSYHCHICIIYTIYYVVGVPVIYSVAGAAAAITAPVSIPVILKYYNHHHST